MKISQGPYIDIILTHFHIQDANSTSTPLNKSVKLMAMVPTQMIDVPYTTAVSSLMYAALRTRPNIAFAIQHLSQFINSHGPEHWTTVKHMLMYLKGTQDNSITFRQDKGPDLQIYTDSDFANRTDALSIGGYVGILGGGTIAWSSKKQ